MIDSPVLETIYSYLQDPDLWQGSASELNNLEEVDARVNGILSGLYTGTGGSIDYTDSYYNNNVENELYYWLDDQTYDGFQLAQGLVYDNNTAYNLAGVDFWISDGSYWYDINDPTDFTVMYEDNRYASFNHWLDISGYPTGDYTLWGQAYDIDGQYTGNQFTNQFRVEAAPSYLQWTVDDTVSGWVYHADGSSQLYYMDIWLLPQGGQWQNLGYIDNFQAWSEDTRWAGFDFQLDMSGYQPNTYTLWAQAYDLDGQASLAVVDDFQLY